MKTIIISIILSAVLTTISYSKSKSCKIYKKNSNEYKLCVDENVKMRRAKINKKFNKVNSLPKTFSGLTTEKNDDSNNDNIDQIKKKKYSNTLSGLLKNMNMGKDADSATGEKKKFSKTITGLFKKNKDVDQNIEISEKKDDNKTLMGMFRRISKGNKNKIDKDQTEEKKINMKSKKTLADLFGWSK
jgi:hypothetical protein